MEDFTNPKVRDEFNKMLDRNRIEKEKSRQNLEKIFPNVKDNQWNSKKTVLGVTQNDMQAKQQHNIVTSQERSNSCSPTNVAQTPSLVNTATTEEDSVALKNKLFRSSFCSVFYAILLIAGILQFLCLLFLVI